LKLPTTGLKDATYTCHNALLTLQMDVYSLKIRFEKLFADPVIFDQPRSFAREFLRSRYPSQVKTEEIYETTEGPSPLDDQGRPSETAGIGKFRYRGSMLRSEFMKGANIRISYTDFGSGLGTEDHRRAWDAGSWNDLAFQVQDFQHQHVTTGIADVTQLYTMIKSRATPTTMATVELPGTSGSAFTATVQYVRDRLGQLALREGANVEVYAANGLEPSENRALEKRLGRDSSQSTVYIILSTSPSKPKDV
jgi:hypothetical protein